MEIKKAEKKADKDKEDAHCKKREEAQVLEAKQNMVESMDSEEEEKVHEVDDQDEEIAGEVNIVEGDNGYYRKVGMAPESMFGW